MRKGCHVLTIFSPCKDAGKLSTGHTVVSEETFRKIQRVVATNERAPMTRQGFMERSLARFKKVCGR